MKTALVHDYLKEYGGAERVLQALHEIYPKAPIYTAFCDKNSTAAKAFPRAKIIESWLAPLVKHRNLYSPLRFLAPAIWKSFDFSGYDLVITSASWYITRGFKKGPKTKVLCYCHTPPRYLYGYPTSVEWQKYWLVKVYAAIVNHFLRIFDYRSAQEVDKFIVNSQNVAQRVKKFYRKDSIIIYPPVDIPKQFSTKTKTEGHYFLTGGRLEGGKNFELIIQACTKLNLPLKVYGEGSKKESLKKLAGPKTEFLGKVDDQKKEELIFGCQAFIVAATDEDFGITPVEAMAGGKPVIAYHGGGYLETVIKGKTGEFFNQPTVESLALALQGFKPSAYKPEDCRKQAEKFSKERFIKEIVNLVEKEMKNV